MTCGNLQAVDQLQRSVISNSFRICMRCKCKSPDFENLHTRGNVNQLTVIHRNMWSKTKYILNNQRLIFTTDKT